MGLTRSMLKGMGLNEEQVSAVIESHIETVDALKEERDSYKESAGKLKDVQKELDELKKAGGDWQKKYEDEHSAFEAYKTDIDKKESTAKKEKAYRELLKECKIDDKCLDAVMRVADLTNITLEDGKIKEAEALKESIKNDWSGFIVTENASGARTTTPPTTDTRNAQDLAGLSIEEYIAARSKM